MTFLIDYTIKTSLILATSLVTVVLLRRKSAAVRHWVLSAAIFAAAIIPLAALVMPSWNPRPGPRISLLSESYAGLQLSGSTPAKPVESQPRSAAANWPAIPAYFPRLVWLGGLAAGVAGLVTGSIRLARVAFFSQRVTEGRWAQVAETISRQYGLRRHVRLLRSRNRSMLATWGLWRPKVLLPAGSEDWPDDRVRAVLCHELAHVRRRDWLVQTTAEMLRAVCWFNPLLWVACNRLRLESEYACDDAVLAQGIAGQKYAADLLDVVRALHQNGLAWSAALTMARPSTLERRFTAMLNPRLDRRPLTHLTMLAIVVAALGVTLPLAAISSAPSQTSSGRITGVVSDRSGEAVSGATVIVSTPDGRTQGTAVTSAEGRFALTGLPSGSYVLQVFSTGFGPSRMINVELHPGKDVGQNLTLDIGFVKNAGAAAAATGPHTYRGEAISMKLQMANIKDFLQLFADIGELELGFGSSVRGAITAQFTNVPWDEALDIVLSTARLKGESQGKVLHIENSPLAPQENMSARTATIGGRIVGIQFQNPSTVLQVEAPNGRGTTQVWPVRWAGASQLTAQGVKENLLHIGDHVVITGNVEEMSSNEEIHLITIKRPSDGFAWGGRPWINYRPRSDTALFVMSGSR